MQIFVKMTYYHLLGNKGDLAQIFKRNRFGVVVFNIQKGFFKCVGIAFNLLFIFFISTLDIYSLEISDKNTHREKDAAW